VLVLALDLLLAQTRPLEQALALVLARPMGQAALALAQVRHQKRQTDFLDSHQG